MTTELKPPPMPLPRYVRATKLVPYEERLMSSRDIDDAVKAGRIVFEPGWNAQPQGDARNVVQPELQDPPWDEAGDFHYSAKVLQRYAAREWALAYGQECFAAGMQASTQASEPSALSPALIKKLTALQVGGCTCGTKTPDIEYHDQRCHYRLASEIENLLNAAPAQASEPSAKPVAFVHWPLNDAPRLVWYSNAVMEDAIRKAYEGHQPNLLLYPAAPARAVEPLTLKEIETAFEQASDADEDVHIRFARAIEQAHGIGAAKPNKDRP